MIDISYWVGLVGEAYIALVESELIRMPVGFTLCVHNELHTDFFGPGDIYKTTMTSHLLPPDMTCSERVYKQQYGPKTPEVQAEIEKYLREQPR